MRLLIIYVFLTLLSIYSYSQETDSLSIKNFGTGDYKAASANYTVTMDDEGILYFANENGILKYDGSEWELIPIADFGGVYSITIAPDGRFYVGGLNEYGYLERDTLGQYNYHSLRQSLSKDLEFGPFWQIEYQDGEVFFSSYQGLVRYDGEGSHHIDIKNSGIFKIDGEVIASKFDDGIYSVKDDTAKLINKKYIWKDDNVYNAIRNLKDSTYILATSENGLFSYDPESGDMQPFKTSDDEYIKKNGIYDAQIWRDSLYILSTWHGGVLVLNKDGQIISTIDKTDGLKSNSFYDFVIDKRGHVWAGGPSGISYLQWPDDHFKKPFHPKTRITSVKRKSDIDNTLRSLEFHFATPGYDKSDLQYSYYLKGYEQEFTDWSGDVKKEYTNLDGGNYEFRVRAKLPDGNITEVASYSFKIPTPWYKTNVFYILSFILSIIIVTILFRYRTKRLKLLNKRLERIINNRTQELIAQREQLKVANEELIVANTELDNFVYRSSHDLVAPLKSLKGLINLAQTEETDPQQIEYLKLMNSSVAKLEEFIKSIMEYSVNSKREIGKEDIVLDEIIESISQDLQYYDNANKVKMIKNYDRDLILKSDKSRLKIVLSNLITNCIKYHNYHQEQPIIEIKVDLNYHKGISEIQVVDNGMGIDQEHLDKIFDMFFRASSDKAEGSGLGLYIVKDTVSKIGGQIDVDSQLGKGTRFTVTLYDSLDVMHLSSSV